MSDEILTEEKARQVYGEDYIDVTDQVEHYEHGKTFECDCGQGFGVVYEESHWKCPSCGEMLVDRKANVRSWEGEITGANEDEGRTQSGLDAFM